MKVINDIDTSRFINDKLHAFEIMIERKIEEFEKKLIKVNFLNRTQIFEKIKKLETERFELIQEKKEKKNEVKLLYAKIKEMEYGRFDNSMKAETFMKIRHILEADKIVDVPIDYIYEDFEECGGLSMTIVVHENGRKKLIDVCEKEVNIIIDETGIEKIIRFSNDGIELYVPHPVSIMS